MKFSEIFSLFKTWAGGVVALRSLVTPLRCLIRQPYRPITIRTSLTGKSASSGSIMENDGTGNGPIMGDFPVETYIDKSECQQPEFIKKYNADGRGILIAILDTGVDPSLKTLHLTSTGDRKIVDLIDCSGAGDVDTSTVKKANHERKLIGLTGRKLKIPENWQNPTNKWHLGTKPIYELYPKSLRKIVKEEWQRESWDSAHQLAKSDALRVLQEHEELVGGFSDDVKDKHDRENLASKLEFLRSMDKLEDKGPVADCIVWNDGDKWRACIDTSFRGRLSLCKALGEFRVTGEYAKISDRDEACYSFRVENAGNRLEICLANGAHGSHVACIAAGYEHSQPNTSGLAPGAQIVSMMIGDNRIDSMETGTAIIRALNLCAEMNVDVVNMSFGEGSHFPASGRIIEEIQRLVYQHNVVFVSSAGNSGPALSTVGSPGGTTPGVIGVGAHICAKQAEPLYGVHDDVTDYSYPWSARGPCTDGSLGVSLCAVGAAFAEVPRYCRKSRQVMNGTSMSSPNVAGAIACLLSKLRAEGIEWSAFLIRLALENTAKKDFCEVRDLFATGNGVVQLEEALACYKAMVKHLWMRHVVDMQVRVTNLNKSRRGVYIRELNESLVDQEYTITVQPKFKEQTDSISHAELSMEMFLKCERSDISFPEVFMLTAEGRSFTVKIPRTVCSESPIYTQICGYSAKFPGAGPIFRVPITIIRPDLVDDDFAIDRQFDYATAVPIRQFIHVPADANVCQVFVKDFARESLNRFTLHCVQLEDDKCYRNSESYKLLSSNSYEWTKTFSVIGSRTLEVCLVQNWTRAGKSEGKGPRQVQIYTRFYGVQRQSNINLIHGCPYAPIRISAARPRPVEIKPAISLSALHVPFKPVSAKIEPLGPRDITTNSKQIHRLLLIYKFTTTKSCEVRLDLPGVTSYLYESPYDCIFMQLFSPTKEFLGASSSYPERYTYKLEKGEYTAHVQVRHPETSQLELLMDTPLQVRVHVSPALNLDVTSAPNAGEDAFKWSNKALMPSQQTTLYAGSLPDDKLPKTVSIVSGSFLTGSLVLMNDNELRQADKTTITYWFTEYSTRPSKALSMVTLREKKSESSGQEEKDMEDAIRDTQISWLTKLKDPVAVERLYSELIAKYPTHLPLLLTKMKLLVDKKRSKTETETMNLIIQQILEQCRVDDVLKYLGARQENSGEQIALKKNMDDRKAAIIDCLLGRAHYVIDTYLRISKDTPEVFRKPLMPVFGLSQVKDEEKTVKEKEDPKEGDQPTDESETKKVVPAKELEKEDKVTLKEVDEAYLELLNWIAADDNKVLILSAKHSIAHAHYGKACTYLQKLIEDMRSSGKDASNIELAQIEVCEALGWSHITTRLRNERLVRNRPTYRLF